MLEERTMRTDLGSAADTQAILSAFKRLGGGKAQRVKVARALRDRVLGMPALEDVERTRRIAAQRRPSTSTSSSA